MITLRAAAVVPPIVFPEAPLEITTPMEGLPSGRLPVTSVPMKFPVTAFLVVPVSRMMMPYSRLPEITFLAPLAVPPIVFPEALVSMTTP